MSANQKLTKHLRSIAAKGGEKGGKARMEAMTPAERRLLAIKATMAKLKGHNVSLWVAGCTYRGNSTYTVMGCAAEPERQFRQARKAFPNGTKVNWIRTGTIPAEQYIELVKDIRDCSESMASWTVRALIQVGKGHWKGYVSLTTVLGAAETTAWLTPKRPGRPRNA